MTAETATTPAPPTRFIHADYDTVPTYGSEIVIAGRPEDVERFVESE